MFWIFLIILFLTTLTIITGQYGTDCFMPNQERGLCMPVKSCKPIYEIFTKFQQTGGHTPTSDLEKLSALQCGRMKDVFLVCCKESEIQLNPDGLDILKNTTCGSYSINKVSHGKIAALFGFPWMALFEYDDPDTQFKCAGSFVSDQYILTAAHCVHKLKNRIIGVRLGEYKISTKVDCTDSVLKKECAPPVEDVGIEEIIIHESFRSPFYNDIALVRLNRKIQNQRHIKPICLPIYDDLRGKEYEKYVISGWGGTENGTSADILQVAVVSGVELRRCEALLSKSGLRHPLTVGQKCAGGEDLIDTCKGDSGGPMGYRDNYNGRPRFIQFGIVSAGITGCGVANEPGIYTNVSHYIQWITDHMR